MDKEEFIGSKILNIKDRRVAYIVVAKDNENIIIYLNGEKIFHIKDKKIISLKEELEIKAHPSNEKVIIHDLNEWVLKRKENFKIKTSTSNEYEIIPLEKQEEQFQKAIRSLESLINSSIQNEGLHDEHILASLRSLLFYKEKSSNYDPLLLRLATYKEMSLPIWVNPSFSKIEDSTSLTLSVSCLASIKSTGCNFKMIDFQEYLESNFIKSCGNLLTPLQFIESSSTNRSTAHFDQRIPKTIINIDNAPIVNNKNLFNRILIELANLTVDVGKMIINKE